MKYMSLLSAASTACHLCHHPACDSYSVSKYVVAERDNFCEEALKRSFRRITARWEKFRRRNPVEIIEDQEDLIMISNSLPGSRLEKAHQ